MRTRIIALICASALALSIPVVATPIIQADVTGSISGMITLPAGHSFRDASLATVGEVRACVFNQVTDVIECFHKGSVAPDGSYTIDNLSTTQKYIVFVTPQSLPIIPADVLTTTYGGYSTPYDSDYRLYYGDDPSISLVSLPSDGSPVVGIDIEVVQGAIITGTVSPAAAANKALWICELKNNEFFVCNYLKTGNDGSYVAVASPGATVVILAEADGYLSMWYGGAFASGDHDQDLANPQITTVVTPPAGGTLTDIDLMLLQGATLSGVITPISADKSNDLMACWTNDDKTWNCVNGIIQSDGSYSILVSPGAKSTVCAFSEDYLWTCLGGYTSQDKPTPADMSKAAIKKVTAPAAGLTLPGLDIRLSPKVVVDTGGTVQRTGI